MHLEGLILPLPINANDCNKMQEIYMIKGQCSDAVLQNNYRDQMQSDSDATSDMKSKRRSLTRTEAEILLIFTLQ